MLMFAVIHKLYFGIRWKFRIIFVLYCMNTVHAQNIRKQGKIPKQKFSVMCVWKLLEGNGGLDSEWLLMISTYYAHRSPLDNCVFSSKVLELFWMEHSENECMHTFTGPLVGPARFSSTHFFATTSRLVDKGRCRSVFCGLCWLQVCATQFRCNIARLNQNLLWHSICDCELLMYGEASQSEHPSLGFHFCNLKAFPQHQPPK